MVKKKNYTIFKSDVKNTTIKMKQEITNIVGGVEIIGYSTKVVFFRLKKKKKLKKKPFCVWS